MAASARSNRVARRPSISGMYAGPSARRRCARGLLAGHVHGLGAVLGRQHLGAEALQHASDDDHVDRVVLGHQHALAGQRVSALARGGSVAAGSSAGSGSSTSEAAARAAIALHADAPAHARVASSRQMMDRPRPVPPKRRVVLASAWLKGSEQMALVLGTPQPESRTLKCTWLPTPLATSRLTLPVLGELDRVGQEVAQDLL